MGISCRFPGYIWKYCELRIKSIRALVGLAIIAIISAVLAACGSNDTAVVAPKDTAPPAVVAVDTTESTEPAGSEDTQVSAPPPADTNDMASVELKPVDDPATVLALQSGAAPELEPAETALQTSYSDYGFSLKLDLGADVRTSGWTEPEPSMAQGIIAFSYGGVNANLVWGPPEDRTPLTFLADTYNILRASQPSVAFESISDGDLLVNGQPGVYGGFKAVDNSGAAIGGGLIGAWICGDNETSFRMTLTGDDATVVQLRFDRLLENFACSSS